MDNYQMPIRTIKVKPYESNWENNIKEYFAQFGEINSVEMNSENGIQCGFVEFKLVDGATAALSNAVHRISSHDVTVEAAEPWYQPDQILNALDDDCLRAIFKYFELEDLATTADVCSRFKKCAEDAFLNSYKTVTLDGDDADVLIKFGKLIRSLIIDFNVFSVKILSDPQRFITLELINKYTCLKLEELSMIAFRDSKHLINPLVFANLKHLELQNCNIPNLNELLKVCPKLEVLKIEYCSEIGNCLDQQFEQLKEFHLVDSMEGFESIDTFIFRNPLLTKLRLKSDYTHMEVICSIGQYLHRLVELELELDFLNMGNEREERTGLDVHLQNLSKLHFLTVLKLKFKFNDAWIGPLLDELAKAESPLEMISLNNAHITDGAIESMSKLKQLNMIQLDNVNGLTNDHVIQLSKELPNLQHFILKGDSGEDITGTALKTMVRHAKKLSRIEISQADSVSINSSDYFAMLKSVQNRKEKIQLSIILTGSGDIVNVPEEIVAQNREYLFIDEHMYSDHGGEFDDLLDIDDDDFDYDNDRYDDNYDDRNYDDSPVFFDYYRQWT